MSAGTEPAIMGMMMNEGGSGSSSYIQQPPRQVLASPPCLCSSTNTRMLFCWWSSREQTLLLLLPQPQRWSRAACPSGASSDDARKTTLALGRLKDCSSSASDTSPMPGCGIRSQEQERLSPSHPYTTTRRLLNHSSAAHPDYGKVWSGSYDPSMKAYRQWSWCSDWVEALSIIAMSSRHTYICYYMH
jgi:hypothetical protein